MTTLQVGQSSVRIPAIAKKFICLPSIDTSSGAHLGILTLHVEWLGHEFNHSHSLPMLKTSGVTPPLPVCICTEANAFNSGTQ